MKSNKIYIITMIEKLENKHTGTTRLVGWYTNKDEAFQSVQSNNADINEYFYDFALIQEINEGLYHPADEKHRWLFKYNHKTNKYESYKEPDWMKIYVGFGIG